MGLCCSNQVNENGPRTTFWTAQLAEMKPSWLVLSILLRPCQGGPPPSTLSSRLERSVGEGPAVSLSGTAKVPFANCFRVPFLHQRKLQVPPLRYPGFPVETGGVDELHAAFLTESHTRGRWGVRRGRKSGYASVGLTKWRAVAHLGMGGGGWTVPAPVTNAGCPMAPISCGGLWR